MATSEIRCAPGKSSGVFSTEQLINETEAAKILGLKVATLRRWRWAGKPPPYLKIGSAVRYDPVELSAFKEAARRTSTSETGQAA